MFNRKKMILPVILVLLAFFAGMFTFRSSQVYADVDTSGETRCTFDFNYGWKFSKGEGVYNSLSTEAESFDSVTIPNGTQVWSTDFFTNSTYFDYNQNWEDVSLPHTFNDTETFESFNEALDGNSTLSHNGDRTMYSGTAWYKKDFYIPHAYSGQKIYIEFEAARQAAQVWINGVKLDGDYFNGFIAFGYDLTDYLNYGDAETGGAYNEITVLVDNSYPYYVYVDEDENFKTMYDTSVNETISGKTNVNPLIWHDSHWQPNYGGLYRNCWLYVTNPVQFTLPLYSFMKTEGTYIYTSNENGIAKTTDINIDTQIQNSTDKAQNFDIYVDVLDVEGNSLLQLHQSVGNGSIPSLASGETRRFYLSGTLENVIRWSPEYPYLYTVKCTIIQNGTMLDNYSDEIGVRTYRLTSDEGLYLNENYTYLNGWGQKSTNEWAGVGAAYSDWMQDYVISLMKDAGANYIRWGHTAGSATQIEACEKYGILVTQPGVDGEGATTSNVPSSKSLIYTPTSYKVRTDAFRDMIIYFRNSPSIVCWEIGNHSMTSDVSSLLLKYINTYDYGNRGNKTGITTDSNGHKVASGIVSNSGLFSTTTDTSERLVTVRRAYTTSGIDVYETTQTDDISKSNLPKIEGEYNRYEARRGVWDIYTDGFEKFVNKPVTGAESAFKTMTSEEFAVSQVTTFNKMLLSKGKAMTGGANWIFSDSVSHARLLSEVARASGEVDGTMLPKEAYHVCKVLYNNDEITSYLIGHWNYPIGTTKTMYAVSKAHSVKLFVDYIEDGQQKTDEYIGDKSSGYLFTFQDVVFKEGDVRIVGYDEHGAVIPTAGCVKSTHGDPNGLKITVINTEPIVANGADYVILDVEVVDALGNRCSTYSGITYDSTGAMVLGTPCIFSLNSDAGTGIWIGGYNSGIENTIRSNSLYIESGITRVAVKTTKIAGDIIVSANLNGLSSDQITVHTVPYQDAGTSYNYSSVEPKRLTYSLAELSETIYDEANYQEVPSETWENIETSSKFIENLKINGDTTGTDIAILSVGHGLYSDVEKEVEALPTQLETCQYIKAPNGNSSIPQSTELMKFTVKEDCKLIILLDVKDKLPNWLEVEENGFNDTGMVVLAENQTIYKVYLKSLTSGQSYTLNGLGQPESNMYIVGFVSLIDDVNPNLLFTEDFSEILTYEQLLEAFSSTGVVTTKRDGKTTTELDGKTKGIDVELSTIDGVDGIRIYDYASEGVNPGITNNGFKSASFGYIIQEFAAQSGTFILEFDMYINKYVGGNEKIGNKFIRIFFQEGSSFDATGANAAVKLYLDNFTDSGSGGKISDNISASYRTVASDKTTNDMWLLYGTDANKVTGGAVSTNQPSNKTNANSNANLANKNYKTNIWYTFKIEVDNETNTYNLYIKPSLEEASSYAKMNIDPIAFNTQIQTIDHMVIATGNHACNDFNIANIKIRKPQRNTVSDIKIDGTSLPYFHEDTFAYYVPMNDSEFSSCDVLVTTFDGYVYDISKSLENKTITIMVTNNISRVADTYTIYCDNTSPQIAYSLSVNGNAIIKRGDELLSDGALIYDGDQLTISYIQKDYYNQSLLVNGTEFTSGMVYTVSDSNVNVFYSEIGEEYDIEWIVDGGVFDEPAPQTHTYGVETFLPIPTKEGYDFKGWFINDQGNAITSLQATKYTSNISITARWEIKTFSIVSNSNSVSTSVKYGSKIVLTPKVTMKYETVFNYTYQWQYSSDNTNWTNNTTKEILTLSKISQSGYYKLIVTATDKTNSNLSSSYESNALEVTISKANTTILNDPTFQAVYVGQTLSNVGINGGEASVEGEFSWKIPTTTIENEENSVELLFTPNDTENYNVTTKNVIVYATQLKIIVPNNVSVVGSVSGPIENGGNISFGEILTITANPPKNYETLLFTVNDLPFNSGDTIEVTSSPITIVYKMKTDVTLSNEDDSVIVETNTAVVGENSLIEVEVKDNTTSEYKLVLRSIDQNLSNLKVYSIKIYDANESLAQLSEKVVIKLKIPENYNRQNLKVYRVNDDGSKVEYQLSLSDEYIQFETDHFSLYAIADTTKLVEPETKNNTWIYVVGLVGTIILISAIIIPVVIIKKKKIK